VDETTPEGWTLGAYIIHNEAMRALQEKYDNERDRRYAEVTAEREKALKIKETADRTALDLDREIRAYKDEQANNLRHQIESERGMYATHADLIAQAEKIEATVKPLTEYVSSTRGHATGVEMTTGRLYAALFAAVAVIGTLFTLIEFLVS